MVEEYIVDGFLITGTYTIGTTPLIKKEVIFVDMDTNEVYIIPSLLGRKKVLSISVVYKSERFMNLSCKVSYLNELGTEIFTFIAHKLDKDIYILQLRNILDRIDDSHKWEDDKWILNECLTEKFSFLLTNKKSGECYINRSYNHYFNIVDIDMYGFSVNEDAGNAYVFYTGTENKYNKSAEEINSSAIAIINNVISILELDSAVLR